MPVAHSFVFLGVSVGCNFVLHIHRKINHTSVFQGDGYRISEIVQNSFIVFFFKQVQRFFRFFFWQRNLIRAAGVCAPIVDITRRSGFRKLFSELFQRYSREVHVFLHDFKGISEQLQRRITEVGGWVGGVGGREERGQTVRQKNRAEILSATERHSGWRQILQQTALDRPAAEGRAADFADLYQSNSENYEVHHGRITMSCTITCTMECLDSS